MPTSCHFSLQFLFCWALGSSSPHFGGPHLSHTPPPPSEAKPVQSGPSARLQSRLFGMEMFQSKLEDASVPSGAGPERGEDASERRPKKWDSTWAEERRAACQSGEDFYQMCFFQRVE